MEKSELKFLLLTFFKINVVVFERFINKFLILKIIRLNFLFIESDCYLPQMISIFISCSVFLIRVSNTRKQVIRGGRCSKLRQKILEAETPLTLDEISTKARTGEMNGVHLKTMDKMANKINH